MGGLTIREAVAIALEGIPGNDLLAWQRDAQALREHTVAWVKDYAERRGVILSDHDITSELEAIIAELREGRLLARRSP